jgi:hypothetical protein
VDRVQEVLKLDRCNKEASIYPSNKKKKEEGKSDARPGPTKHSTATSPHQSQQEFIHTYIHTHIRTYQNMCTDLRRLDMEAYSWNTTDSVGA